MGFYKFYQCAVRVFDVGEVAGSFTHVYVDRETRRPAELPDELRRVLEWLRAPAEQDGRPSGKG